MHPRRHLLGLGLLLTTIAHAGDSKSPITPSSTDGWEWSLSGGPAWHYLGKLSYAGGSRSQKLALPSFVGSDSLTVPPIGDESATGSRDYNDGYVRPDAGTSFDGSTWFWGYEDAGQVQGSTLAYHATGYQSVRSDLIDTAPGQRARDSMRNTGIEIRADVLTPWRLGPFRIGGMIGLGIVADSQRYAFTNHSTTQLRDDFRLDYLDNYELGEVIPPGAPYHGTLGGPGAVIPNIPASRSLTPVLLFTDRAVFTNQVRAKFDDEALSLTLGPSLVHDQGPWSFALSAGLILEFHHYSARQQEVLDVAGANGSERHAAWTEGDSGTKFRPGLFVQAAARLDVGNDWHLGGFLRGELADQFRVNAGPSRFEFEPVGFTVGAELGFSF